ncbi:zinc finger MYM-type protein 1-like [Lycorma delicatula]|uniref:zinc finger MYM-type protein 1-like n=1 Tax=Lycorma delicatula TaxID=130591 RepID=UPI003F50DBBA
MSKRFESGACKRKKKKLQKYEAKKLTSITAYMHVPTSTTRLEAMKHVTPNGIHQVQDIANLDSDVKYKFIVTDVDFWTNLSQNDVSYWVEKVPSQVQYHCGPFLNSKREYKNRSRFCTKAIFYSTKANGEKYTPEWLVYSPSKCRVFCFVCKLFSNTASSATVLTSEGFNDRKTPDIIQTHENSENYRNAILVNVLNKSKTVNFNFKARGRNRKEQQHWRYVIERVFAVICTLAERGLPFRGDNEKFGTPNNGNYFGLLELEAKFDPFLRDHIDRYGNTGSENPSYLSKSICEEIIQLTANNVKDTIVAEVKKAGYFSFSVDSTPDISHTDRLTLIIRYVSPEDGLPTERFLTFLELNDHLGESIADLIFNYITTELEIDFRKCRGQSYDNATNTASRYNGMQQKIIE